MKSKPGILKSNTAVSETLGYSFILGIVIISVSVMLIVSYPILSNLKDSVFIEASTESLSMLDSRISRVAFGVTPSQPTRFNLNGGRITAQNDSFNRLIVQIANNSGGMDTIFNDSLGLVEFQMGDQKIGYENGGLFRKYAGGDTVMISPPEFHYTEETLTFPILKINSSASIGGKGVININANAVSKNRPEIIYPNITRDPNFANPLINKQIIVRLKSEYYQAWAQYMEERTEAHPLINDLTQEVVISLNSHPNDAESELVMPIEVMGLDVTNSTPLNQFKFNLTGVDPSFQMDLRAPTADSDVFHLNFQKKCGGGQDGAFITIDYNDHGYNESWTSCQLIIITQNLSLDLLNHSVNAEYARTFNSGTWLNETPPYNGTYIKNDGKTVPVDIVIQHYIKLISETGTFAIYKGSKTSDKWDNFNETGSTYLLDYNIMPPNINYLYLVEHAVNIDFH